jgi:DNA polymerase III delta' subunit
MTNFLPNIIGHEKNRQILQKFLESRQIPHAVLFSGPEGVGKETLTREWSKLLLCHNPDSRKLNYCDACSSCNLFSAGTHPDLVVVTLGDDKKDITIDQIRTLISYSNFQPIHSQSKVLIVNHADRMNPSSQNALLKTLEEIPGEQFIILIAHRRDNLLPTILSRVVELSFSRLSDQSMVKILQNIGIAENELEFLLYSLNGTFRDFAYFKESLAEEVAEINNFYTFALGLKLNSGGSRVWSENISQILEKWLREKRETLLKLADFMLARSHRELTSHREILMDAEKRTRYLGFFNDTFQFKKYLEKNGNISLALLNWIMGE